MLLSNPWRHKCDPLEDEIRWAPQKAKGLSQVAIADELGIDRTTVGRWLKTK